MATMRTKGFVQVLVVAAITLALTSVASPQTVKTSDGIDTLRVDSDLVDLKVSVITRANDVPPAVLQPKDFIVLEDGTKQEIAFFAAADTPFDLVLLLDLSASTAKKLNLIRRSAKRFVDTARETDRIAVVTFSRSSVLVCGLTSDRKQLKKSINEIEEPAGGTNFWDALAFVLGDVLAPREASHRRAVVVMSDGVDNALPDVFGEGSQTTFEQLLAAVGSSDTLVFPVYLDTEPEEAKRHRTPRSAYVIARDQLQQLAQASGTIKYEAKELKDLDRVYERVIRDLSTVYSIGYKPSNTVKDGRWRSVSVRLVERPDLAVRTKAGYLAKAETQSLN